MNIAQHIPDDIKGVSKSLGYALWLDNFDDWQGFSIVLRSRLSDSQRAALAFMTLKALGHDQAIQTATAALWTGAGSPIAPFFNPMDEATHWADMAAPSELDAYCLASFNRMTPKRQADFLEFVQWRAAA